MKLSILTTTAFVAAPSYSFQLSRYQMAHIRVRSITPSIPLVQLAASGDDQLPKGMADAFRQLDELTALGDNPFKVPEPKAEADENFSKALKEINLKEIKEASPPPESVVKLYEEMAIELEQISEDDLIASVKEEIESTAIAGTDIPKFDPTTKDKDKFMEKALSEAIGEAEQKLDGAIDKKSLLDNKEIMKEIEEVFERANNKLIQGLEEIREEQMQLAKESAQRNSEKTQQILDEEQQRLAVAEANMKKMLAKVNEETRNVEKAVEDLKRAQEEMDTGLEGQLYGLKSGGIVKQATLVGMLLFSFRSVVEGVAVLGGDTTHLFPAVLQAAIAISCLVAFLFL